MPINDGDFADLAAVIADPLFPQLDQALRSGKHIDRQVPGHFQYLTDAQAFLEEHYARYGADLVFAPDGFFYLRPVGDRLPVSRLGAPEMLVGQALALFYLEPAFLEAGFVTRVQIIERLRDLLGNARLVRGLLPRNRGNSARHRTEAKARQAVLTALRRLASLGFVEAIDDDRVGLRAPLMRFVDPARGSQDLHAALERLVVGGELDWERPETPDAATEGATEEAGAEEADDLEDEEPADDEEEG